jgi:hypothetical protein
VEILREVSLQEKSEEGGEGLLLGEITGSTEN